MFSQETNSEIIFTLKNMWPLKKWTPRNAIQISYQQHPEKGKLFQLKKCRNEQNYLKFGF